MTKQEVLNAANVMIAYANGKKVGTRPTRSMEPLLEILYVPTWNWEQKEYFVIPDDCSKELENDDQAKAHKLTEEEQRIFIASECERMANVTSPNLIEFGQIQKEQSNVSQRDDYFYEKEQLNERIKRLEEWKDSAMAVEREWDANAISTMLGGQLGESQRVVIMREVPRILERIKRLEEVGDKLYSAIYCGCLMDGPCKTCSDAADLWDEIKEAKP